MLECPLIGRIDALILEVIEQFLEIERIALRAGDESFDQCLRRYQPRAEQVLQFPRDKVFGFRRGQTRQRQFSKVRQLSQPQPGGKIGFRRPIGEEEQHRQIDNDPGDDLEQIVRERVKPVTILQDQQNGRSRSAVPQAIGQQSFQRRFPEFGVELPREPLLHYARELKVLVWWPVGA